MTMRKRFLILMLLMMLLGPGFPGARAEETNELTEIRCKNWDFSVRIPSGMNTEPYEYKNPDSEKTEGGGLVIFTEKRDSLPRVWILRRDHVFNNPELYLTDIFYSYLNDVWEGEYEEIEYGLCQSGGMTLRRAGFRCLGEQDEELFRELRLIPYRNDRGSEFVIRYRNEEEDAALSLLDTLIENYRPDEEAEPAEALHRPIPQVPDLLNGTFMIRAADVDKIETEGYFTAVLYMRDRYAAEDIRSLKPGETLQINGRVFTVSSVEPWENDDGSWHEASVTTKEDAPEQSMYGFCFEENEGDYVLYVMDDWYSVSQVAEVRIDADDEHPIAFYDVPGGETPELKTEDLLANDNGIATLDRLNPYNTTCEFRDGRLIRIDSGSYPYGPCDPMIPADPES